MCMCMNVKLCMVCINFTTYAETSHSMPIKEANTVSSNQQEETLSDGERMTAELRDVVSHFTQKVHQVCKCSDDFQPLNPNHRAHVY